MKPVIVFRPFYYKSTPLIRLDFQPNVALEFAIKQQAYVHYSNIYTCYFIRYNTEHLKQLILSINHLALCNIDQVKKQLNKADLINYHKHLTSNSTTPIIRITILNKLCYLSLPVPYKRSWVNFLVQQGCIFEQRRRFWLIPDFKAKKQFISNFFSSEGCKLIYNNKQDEKIITHLKRGPLDTDAELIQFKKIMTLQGASKRTIENYLSQIKKLKVYYDGRSIETITDEEIQDYLFFLREELSYSFAAQNIAISAVKRYLLAFAERETSPTIVPRPKQKRTLPKTLERSEVEAILKQRINLKHKCILFMLYATGIRCGELIQLKVDDINFDNNIIVINKGKGNKGRIVKLPVKLKQLLQQYIRKYRPIPYLFEGQNGGHYSATSIQKVLKNATQKAGINKRVTPHMLRHSYATHLHDAGMDIRNIQRLLGHNCTKTTEIYTYVSKRDISQLKSPLDDLDV